MNREKETVRVTFCGAAQTVTGSKFLIEGKGKKILIDCGLFQGKKELRLRNWAPPPFDPKAISAVVLTHAHVDHVGYLPLIVRHGYRGPIYCTAATKELLGLILPDSARLQEEEARYANEHGTSRHHPAKPLYYRKDADQALSLLETIPRSETSIIRPGFSVTPYCAGHILGSVSLFIDAWGKKITFSGDIGRYDTPILPDPAPCPIGDLLVCESTYGDRIHPVDNAEDELGKIVRGAIALGGPLIIPAFAVGRTQNILYYLSSLERKGRIPVLPVYVDSPMAVDATNIYRRFKHDYDDEALSLLKAGETPLRTSRTAFCREVEDSKRLNSERGPRIIIAASGMVNGGRVLHHMKHWLHREETTVLFVGYQAEGTRGQLIESGAPEVKIFGEYIPIRAQIKSISGFSAHADKEELIRWLSSSTGKPNLVKVVHGEPQASKAFSQTISERLGWIAEPAEHLEQVEI